MTHKHSVYDTDKHFSINPTTREIVNMTPNKVRLMQFDHNSERFTFELPRTIEGHDMSLCNSVKIHFINTGANGNNADVYDVDDLQISPDSEDVIIFSWLISQNATLLAGKLDFLIRFACCGDDGVVEYVWNTAIHSGISISSGMDNGDVIVERYSDILEQWRQQIEGKLEDIQNVRSYYDAETQTLYIIGGKSDDINGGDDDSGGGDSIGGDVPEVCSHESTKTEYISNGDATDKIGHHTIKTVCTICGTVLEESIDACREVAGGVTYVDNGDGTHTTTKYCRYCGQGRTYSIEHTPSNSNADICATCGGTIGG